MSVKSGPDTLMASAGEDRLVRHWSLAPADAAEVLRARGAGHRLRCAAQLCTLRATGRFAAEYRRVPPEAVSHLARQSRRHCNSEMSHHLVQATHALWRCA